MTADWMTPAQIAQLENLGFTQANKSEWEIKIAYGVFVMTPDLMTDNPTDAEIVADLIEYAYNFL